MSDDIIRDNIDNDIEIEIDNPLADVNLPGNVPDTIDGIGSDLPDNYNEDNASEISHEEIQNEEIQQDEIVNEEIQQEEIQQEEIQQEEIVNEEVNKVDEETYVEEIPSVSNAEILFLNKVILDENEIEINVDESKIESEIKDIQQSKLSTPSISHTKPISQLTSIQVSTQTSRQPSQQPSKVPSQKHTPISSLPVSQKASREVSKQQTPITSLPVSRAVSQQVSKAPSQQVSKVPSQQVSKAPSIHTSPVVSQQVSKAPSQQVSVVQTPVVSKPPSQQVSKAPSIHASPLVSRVPSQQVSKAPSQQVSNVQTPVVSKPASQQVSVVQTPVVSKPPSRKNSEILKSEILVATNTTNEILHDIGIESKTNSRRNSKSLNERVNLILEPIELEKKSAFDKMTEHLSNQLGISSTILEESEEDIKKDAAQIETNLPIIVDGPRKRRVDRQLLANDLSSELPITLRYNENVHVDNEVEIDNYNDEWTMWIEDGLDKLDELIMLLDELEDKYKSSSRRNKYVANSIQFLNLLLGSGIVYVQASTTNAELIRDWNTVAGGLSTVSTMVYNYFGFAKKTGQYASIASNIYKLNCWIKSKLILPVDKRFSPFDIYIIGTKALQVILEEAQQKKQDSK